jgi:hypothetical protein
MMNMPLAKTGGFRLRLEAGSIGHMAGCPFSRREKGQGLLRHPPQGDDTRCMGRLKARDLRIPFFGLYKNRWSARRLSGQTDRRIIDRIPADLHA